MSVNIDGLSFHAKTAGKIIDSRIPGNFLDNKWHTVFLQYILGNLTIDIDGDTEVILYSFGYSRCFAQVIYIYHFQLLANNTYHSELLTSPGLYNEGAAVLLIGKQFNGCILEGPSIVFQNNVILSNHNALFESCPIPYDSCLVTDPAPKNFCLTEPCMFGKCVNGLKDYSCQCHPR